MATYVESKVRRALDIFKNWDDDLGVTILNLVTAKATAEAEAQEQLFANSLAQAKAILPQVVWLTKSTTSGPDGHSVGGTFFAPTGFSLDLTLTTPWGSQTLYTATVYLHGRYVSSEAGETLRQALENAFTSAQQTWDGEITMATTAKKSLPPLL